jgi:hypothetical protein
LEELSVHSSDQGISTNFLERFTHPCPSLHLKQDMWRYAVYFIRLVLESNQQFALSHGPLFFFEQCEHGPRPWPCITRGPRAMGWTASNTTAESDARRHGTWLVVPNRFYLHLFEPALLGQCLTDEQNAPSEHVPYSRPSPAAQLQTQAFAASSRWMPCRLSLIVRHYRILPQPSQQKE